MRVEIRRLGPGDQQAVLAARRALCRLAARGSVDQAGGDLTGRLV
jgi:hypothetical protein